MVWAGPLVVDHAFILLPRRVMICKERRENVVVVTAGHRRWGDPGWETTSIKGPLRRVALVSCTVLSS